MKHGIECVRLLCVDGVSFCSLSTRSSFTTRPLASIDSTSAILPCRAALIICSLFRSAVRGGGHLFDLPGRLFSPWAWIGLGLQILPEHCVPSSVTHLGLHPLSTAQSYCWHRCQPLVVSIQGVSSVSQQHLECCEHKPHTTCLCCPLVPSSGYTSSSHRNIKRRDIPTMCIRL